MEHFLTFPDKATWDSFEWEPDGDMYARGPEGQFADIVGENYFVNEDGTREPRAGFLVNIIGELPEAMAQYSLGYRPTNPKRVFLNG